MLRHFACSYCCALIPTASRWRGADRRDQEARSYVAVYFTLSHTCWFYYLTHLPPLYPTLSYLPYLGLCDMLWRPAATCLHFLSSGRMPSSCLVPHLHRKLPMGVLPQGLRIPYIATSVSSVHFRSSGPYTTTHLCLLYPFTCGLAFDFYISLCLLFTMPVICLLPLPLLMYMPVP